MIKSQDELTTAGMPTPKAVANAPPPRMVFNMLHPVPLFDFISSIGLSFQV